MAKNVRISEVGLRGIVGSGLSAEHVLDFASAFGTFLGPGAVVVGRDPRASSVMLREGVIAGLLACGREVIDLGMVSTPVLQHAISRCSAAGGISIGASHNAAEWNALKFLGARGTYLSTAEAG
jgi:phosphomannomutase